MTLNALDYHPYKAIHQLANKGEHYHHTQQWQKIAALAEADLQTLILNKNDYQRGPFGISIYLHSLFHANFYRGMELYQNGNQEDAIELFDQCHQLTLGSGMQADHFFPTLQNLDLGEVYDSWFEESYSLSARTCEIYPGAHNSHNTAAWLSSRAVRRLDDGLAHAEAALESQPHQAAYLDTMAEIWLAKDNRVKALKWAKKSMVAGISHTQGTPRRESTVIDSYKMFLRQQDHFKKRPSPQATEITTAYPPPCASSSSSYHYCLYWRYFSVKNGL